MDLSWNTAPRAHLVAPRIRAAATAHAQPPQLRNSPRPHEPARRAPSDDFFFWALFTATGGAAAAPAQSRDGEAAGERGAADAAALPRAAGHAREVYGAAAGCKQPRFWALGDDAPRLQGLRPLLLIPAERRPGLEVASVARFRPTPTKECLGPRPTACRCTSCLRSRPTSTTSARGAPRWSRRWRRTRRGGACTLPASATSAAATPP